MRGNFSHHNRIIVQGFGTKVRPIVAENIAFVKKKCGGQSVVHDAMAFKHILRFFMEYLEFGFTPPFQKISNQIQCRKGPKCLKLQAVFKIDISNRIFLNVETYFSLKNV